jgi:hypothetical protein
VGKEAEVGLDHELGEALRATRRANDEIRVNGQFCVFVRGLSVSRSDSAKRWKSGLGE